MFERFDQASRRAVFFARWRASLEATSEITTSQLLRGALQADPGLAERLGPNSDGTPATVAFEEIDKARRHPNPQSTSMELPLSENAKKALKVSLETIDRQGRQFVTCGDLLTALFHIEESSAAKDLESFDLSRLEEAQGVRQIPLLVLGVGGVGRALVRQILELREFHIGQFGLALGIELVADSGAVVVAGDGAFRGDDLRSILRLKGEGRSLAERSDAKLHDASHTLIRGRATHSSIVVDCSASEDTGPLLAELAEAGIAVVLANKKPLTDAQHFFESIAGRERPPLRSRWESTVGAGLPVIASLNRLCACGDQVARVLGSLSSTLGSLMTGLQEGRRFSELVEEAMRAGYTEPDPREDLRGRDVARKAVIVARTLGWSAELRDVEVERLYPAAMDSLAVADFMHQLPRIDADFQARSQAAADRGNVLRYVASISPGSLAVGVTEVPLESPLGRLTGNNQIVQIHSRWYDPNPLVIHGRGAGVDATAAGVLADIVELALIRPSRR